MQPDDQEANLDEVRALIGELPGPDLAATTSAIEALRRLGLTPLDAGPLAAAGEWLATWQARAVPRMARPRVALFAATHGIAAGEAPRIAALVQASVDGNAVINRLCTAVDADLRIYELAVETPTRDMSAEPAMDEAEVARAAAYGMMAVEQGIDVLVLGGIAGGDRAAAAALAALLFDLDPAALAGDAAPAVAAAVALHGGDGDAFDALCRLGGFETAAMVGAILAARLARTPVLLDGIAALAAAAVLRAAYPRSLDHCRLAGPLADPAEAALAAALELVAVADTGAGSLGVGAAGVTAIGVLRAAAGIYDAG